MRQVLTEDRPLAMAGRTADKLIAAGNGDAALLYLYILRQAGSFDRAAAGAALSWPEDRVEKAFRALEREGLVGPGAAAPAGAPPRQQKVLEPAEELPQYELEEIRKKSAGGEFASLLTEVQRLLGRVLSTTDLTTLFGIYDHLGLPAEVILLLVSHCGEEFRRRYGEGRRVPMKTIEKTAYLWAREELFSLAAADAYLKARAARQTEEAKVRAMLGIRDRRLAPTEERYIRAWVELGYTAEVLELAYDRTVVNTGALSWKYMDSIVRSWNAKGLKTIQDIETRDGSGKKTGRSAVSDGGDDLALLRKELGMK